MPDDEDKRYHETRPLVSGARPAEEPRRTIADGIVRCWCATCQRNADVREKDMTCLGCGQTVRGFEMRPELDGKDK